MATAEQLITEIAELRAVASSGVLTVRHSDGRSVTYQSLASLEEAIARREAELERLEGRRRRRTMRVYQSGKGL